MLERSNFSILQFLFYIILKLLFLLSIVGKDSRREHIATGEQLHLTNVREQDAGVYECVADPHNDLAISHTFSVTVNGG